MSEANGIAEGTTGRGAGNPLRRGLIAFGRFWWDFLIGDTPELFLATLVVIALAELLHRRGAVGVVVVIAAAIGFLVASVWRGSSHKID